MRGKTYEDFSSEEASLLKWRYWLDRINLPDQTKGGVNKQHFNHLQEWCENYNLIELWNYCRKTRSYANASLKKILMILELHEQIVSSFELICENDIFFGIIWQWDPLSPYDN